jgi:trimethylamine-N-oxide reductase (cytochrome c)
MLRKYKYPAGDGLSYAPDGSGTGVEPRMAWIDNPCWSVCWNEGFKFVDMYKSSKLETIVCEHMYFDSDVQFADLILPVNTLIEENDIMSTKYARSTAIQSIMIEEPAINPIGESMSDYELCAEVAKKLEKYGGIYEDLYNKYTDGKTVEEWIRYWL